MDCMTTFSASDIFLAPMNLDTIATVPIEMPKMTVKSMPCIVPLMPTAARADGPTFPTNIMSTIVKASCKRLLNIMGKARYHKFRTMLPSVRSFDNSFKFKPRSIIDLNSAQAG